MQATKEMLIQQVIELDVELAPQGLGRVVVDVERSKVGRHEDQNLVILPTDW